MNIKIYEYSDYRKFLTDLLDSQPKKGHGVRSLWATAMGCQVAYVSHVLNSHYEISLEQAEGLSRFLALNKDETEFFLLLVQKSRAGTHQLKQFYNGLIQEKIKGREQIRHRMQIKATLNETDQAVYYSSWIYSAVHILLTIPDYQTQPELIAKYFNQDLALIRKVLEFLETRSLIQLKNGRYLVQNNFLFIDKESPLFPHQQNFWRQKAIESIYKNRAEEIHFASIFTVSESDIKKIKDVLLKSIEDCTEIIKPSKEERLYTICMDLFEVN